MRKKFFKSRAFWLISFSVIVIVAVVLARQFDFATAKASNVENPVEVINLAENREPLEQDARLGTSMQTVNGITIEASNFRIEGSYFVADVCFDLPDSADWQLPRNMYVEYNDQTSAVYEWGLIDFRKSPLTGESQRCDDVNFPVDEGKDFSTFKIVIPRLETSWADTLDCEAAQQKLDAQNSGIVITCIHEEGYSGPEVVSRPETLSDEDMYSMIFDAFTEIMDGPWIFEGFLE